jgi:hypothetical protein
MVGRNWRFHASWMVRRPRWAGFHASCARSGPEAPRSKRRSWLSFEQRTALAPRVCIDRTHNLNDPKPAKENPNPSHVFCVLFRFSPRTVSFHDGREARAPLWGRAGGRGHGRRVATSMTLCVKALFGASGIRSVSDHSQEAIHFFSMRHGWEVSRRGENKAMFRRGSNESVALAMKPKHLGVWCQRCWSPSGNGTCGPCYERRRGCTTHGCKTTSRP